MPKRVLLISNAYWPSIGGIENSLRHLAQEAVADGYSVEIIVSDIGVPEDESDRYQTMVDGISVERYPVAPLKGLIFKPFNLLLSNWKLYQKLLQKRRHDPSSKVIARFHFGALIALWAGFTNVRYLVPSVIAQQSAGEVNRTESMLKRLRNQVFISLHSSIQKAALRKCQNWVFSETMRRQCMHLAGNDSGQYQLTKPGVDAARFHPLSQADRLQLRAQLNLPADKPIILFVGRFVRAKGVDLLIDAMSEVHIDCHLVLVGHGAQQVDYESRISSLGLASRVSFVAPTRQVERYYQAADVFVMSSRYEPLGQTILEALASGLPLVAFKRGAEVDTATQELGMDFAVRYAEQATANGLASAISESIAQPADEQTRVNISEKALQKFNWNTLFRELIAQQ